MYRRPRIASALLPRLSRSCDTSWACRRCHSLASDQAKSIGLYANKRDASQNRKHHAQYFFNLWNEPDEILHRSYKKTLMRQRQIASVLRWPTKNPELGKGARSISQVIKNFLGKVDARELVIGSPTAKNAAVLPIIRIVNWRGRNAATRNKWRVEARCQSFPAGSACRRHVLLQPPGFPPACGAWWGHR